MKLIRYLTSLPLSAVPLAALQQHADSGMREELESLLTVNEPSAGFIAVALGVAFLAGAAHALTPGHGKAIVAAYLAGSRGTISDAIYLGAVVTITHTGMVFILGLAALYAAQHFLMDQVYAWLSFASGLLICGIGVWLFWTRWKALRSGNAPQHGHSHSHWPFTHSHSHNHSSESSHTSREHPHGDSSGHVHAHPHPHDHEHGADHGHEHGHEHSHLPKSGRGSLLSLGISGGLVPCPEAMAVLLISFTINRLLFGLIILLAFSLGLAAVLIAIGVAMVLAGPTLSRFSKDSPLMRLLPVGSALVVTLLGAAILYKAAGDAGLLRF